MHAKRICASLLMLAVTATGAARAQDTPEKNAAAHFAARLVDDARETLSNGSVPPETAALQAAALLQFAVKQVPSDVHTWRLLAETARIANRADLQKEALRKIIAADSGDLVSQVHYIELLAGASQTIEQRAAVYQKALAETTLDKQIRSEVAVRLGWLEEKRGDLGQARGYFNQAVQLNDVNVEALRGLVRLAGEGTTATPGEQAKTLATLLAADPYQADAWLQLARLCETAGVPDRAVDFLQTGGEQFAMNGAPISGDFRLELAMQFGIAGQRVPGYTLAETLAELPDAPLGAMLVAELLAQSLTAAGTPLPPVTIQPSTQPQTQPAWQRGAEIRKRLSVLAGKMDNPAALADAAGADLTILPTPGPDTVAWIDAYAKLVAPDDATLARLRGWLLFRQNKLDDALTTLEKVAKDDPLARLGVARILIDQGKTARATGELQAIWAANPSGVLALQTVLAAQKAKITLADSTAARDVRAAITKLTPAIVGMHRAPRDVGFTDARFRKDSGIGTPLFATGEPVQLQLRLTNTSGRAVPVGSDGVIKTMAGLAAAVRTAGNSESTPLGLYAIEDLQRVYRLEPQQIIETTLRADQGRLAEMLQRNPQGTFDVNITVVTAPRVLGSQQYSDGVGGLVLHPGDFRRAGFPLTSKAESDRLVQDLAGLNGDKLLIRIEVTDAVLASSADDALKAKLSAALTPLAGAGDARVRATLLRGLPATGIGAELEKAATALAQDPDPLVRLTGAQRAGKIAWAGGDAGTKAVELLQQRATAEKDDAVRQWLDAEVAALKEKK